MSESERIVCLGDSITEGLGDERGIGWVGRLTAHLAQTWPSRWHVNNLGVAGDTCIDIRHRLLTEVFPRAPARLVISAGVNDTTQRLWPAAAGEKVDPSYARDIWRQIFTALKTQGTRCLILGLAPVDETKLPLVYCPYDELDRGHDARNARIERYEAMLKQEAELAGFPFVPLFTKLAASPYSRCLPDGLHPNGAGYDLLAAEILLASDRLNFFRPS